MARYIWRWLSTTLHWKDKKLWKLKNSGAVCKKKSKNTKVDSSLIDLFDTSLKDGYLIEDNDSIVSEDGDLIEDRHLYFSNQWGSGMFLITSDKKLIMIY